MAAILLQDINKKDTEIQPQFTQLDIVNESETKETKNSSCYQQKSKCLLGRFFVQQVSYFNL